MNTNQELLSTQEGTTTTPSTKLLEQKKVDGTPFIMIKTNDQCFLTYGEYRISDYKNNEEELLEELKEKPWQILGAFTIAMIEMYNKYEERQKEINKQ